MSAPPDDLDAGIPAEERAFYVDEFAGSTIVVALSSAGPGAVAAVASAATALRAGGSHLVVVASQSTRSLAAALPDPVVSFEQGSAEVASERLADLWLAIVDHGVVVVEAGAGAEASVAAELAVHLRALKLVLTDDAGGWGRPPRSFADVVTHADAYEAQLGDRQGGAVVRALARALDGGVTNVNLCRPEDVDRELFTFDGAGTLFTSGGYVELGPLRVDDLPAVERLVAQGVADGLLRPRARAEVARLAVTGLGARVVGSGHLAGIVSLEVAPYREDRMGEVACLYTVSRFSGAGAGALLVDGLVEHAATLDLDAVFAVTVSEAAAAFFLRKGFAEVAKDEVPAAKWAGYDAERLGLARAFVRPTATADPQASFGF